jgi:hypothetical protein
VSRAIGVFRPFGWSWILLILNTYRTPIASRTRINITALVRRRICSESESIDLRPVFSMLQNLPLMRSCLAVRVVQHVPVLPAPSLCPWLLGLSVAFGYRVRDVEFDFASKRTGPGRLGLRQGGQGRHILWAPCCAVIGVCVLS